MLSFLQKNTYSPVRYLIFIYMNINILANTIRSWNEEEWKLSDF